MSKFKSCPRCSTEGNICYHALNESCLKLIKAFTYETVEDGYVIYRDGWKIEPWDLVGALNGVVTCLTFA